MLNIISAKTPMLLFMEWQVDTRCTYKHIPNVLNAGSKFQEWQKIEFCFVQAYKMLCILHCNDKNNWVSNVCFTLYRYGFGHVWEHQGVENVSHFLRVFKQRLIDCHLQDWNSSIMSSDRYAFYSTFKQLHELPPYLTIIKNTVMRKTLTRLRLGVSALRPHWFIGILKSL